MKNYDKVCIQTVLEHSSKQARDAQIYAENLVSMDSVTWSGFDDGEEAFKAHVPFWIRTRIYTFCNLKAFWRLLFCGLVSVFFFLFFFFIFIPMKYEGSKKKADTFDGKIVATNISLSAPNTPHRPRKGALGLTSCDVPEQVCFIINNEEVLMYLLSLKVPTLFKYCTLCYFLQ